MSIATQKSMSTLERLTERLLTWCDSITCTIDDTKITVYSIFIPEPIMEIYVEDDGVIFTFYRPPNMNTLLLGIQHTLDYTFYTIKRVMSTI
jgi:hypothetical protein